MSYLPTSRRRRESLLRKSSTEGRDQYETISMTGSLRSRSRLCKILGLLLVGTLALLFFLPSSGKSVSDFVRQRTSSTRNTDTDRCSKPLDPSKPLVQYVLMIDAGSTGSRIHVYKFNNCGAVPELEKEEFKMIQGGLSDYGKRDDWQGAADSLNVLMDVAVKEVPEHLQGCSPLALKATAGLRLLGAEKSAKVLDTIKTHLETQYPFPVVKKDGVIIMEGKDEGVYAWITTNYLLGNIGSPDRTPTAAVFDLGGGSTQIVFEPEFEIDGAQMTEGEHKYLLTYAGREFILYQQSHLGYGLMEARKSIHQEVANTAQNLKEPVINPCLAPGSTKEVEVVIDGQTIKVTMVGPTENGATQCRFLAEKILKKDNVCKAAPCSFNGIYQPELAKTFAAGEAYIFSYFYDRLTPLGFPSSFSLEEVNALTNLVCEGQTSWAAQFSAVAGALEELEERPEYCLDLSYMTSLLHSGYDMPMDRRLKTAKKIKDNELGWCLGASLPLLDSGTGGWECRVKEIH